MKITDSDAIAACSICESQSARLVSDRPLHRGARQTKFICERCVDIASRHLAGSRSTGWRIRRATCGWCGRGEARCAAAAGLDICEDCISHSSVATRHNHD